MQWKNMKWFIMLYVLTASIVNAGDFKPEYAKKLINIKEAILVDKQLHITYTVPSTTLWYSDGVNYSKADNELRLFINKCYYKKTCNPMLLSLPVEPKNTFVERIIVPYTGEKIIMVYMDGEEQIYPKP